MRSPLFVPVFKEDGSMNIDPKDFNVGGKVSGGTATFFKTNHEDMTARYKAHNNPLAEITKDKAMFRAITEGNASDKALKRDVEAIERKRVETIKQKSRETKKKKISDMKIRYKKKYGVDPL